MSAAVSYPPRPTRAREDALSSKNPEALDALVAHVPLVLWTTDEEGRVTFARGRALEALGFDVQSAIGIVPKDLFAQATLRTTSAETITPQLAHVRVTAGETLSVVVHVGERAFDVWLQPRFDAQKRFVGTLGIALDATERESAERARTDLHRAELSLQKTETMLRAIVDSSPAAIISTDLRGRVSSWNPAAERIFGWSAAETIGHELPTLEPALRAETLQAIACGEPTKGLVTSRRTKTGRTVDVVVHRAPLRDDAGTIVGSVGTIVDLTEQRQLERELEQSQKLEAIGRLAGGIAHDFNNMLAAIAVSSEMLAEAIPPSDPLQEDVKVIHEAAERAANLTRQLLVFGRRQQLDFRITDPNELIGNLAKMLRRMIGEDIELVTNLDANAGAIRVDRGQLEQVLMNLAVNARDAMPNGGKLVIETHPSPPPPEVTGAERASTPAWVRIDVSDSGVGMDGATLRRIFEPFFTTKEQGKGTGLGLAIVYGIVRQSGGYVRVESRVGSGSTFSIFLPWRDGDSAPPSEQVTPTARPSGVETVLVLEDEPLVRRLVSRILRANGYVVVEAANAGEALLVCEDPRERIDLVLSDVVLPRVNGPELVERLRKARPKLKALFVSGYAGEELERHGSQLEGNLVSKPFDAETLLRRVRASLDAQA